MVNKDNTSMIKESFFVGEYERSVDKQKRIAIPSNWRLQEEKNEVRFFLLPGRNSTIQIVPFNYFQNFLNKIKKISFANKSAIVALTQIGSKAHECICDKQGRIQIPQRLFDYTGLSKSLEEQIILVGAFTSIQMMSLKNWQEMQTDNEDCLDQIQQIEESGNEDILNILQNFSGMK